MDTRFDPFLWETKLYTKWEQSGLFRAPLTGKPYTILMPPPNANASLHAGHGMYTVDDIMIRYKRIKGFSALWIPGMDHAGLETQFVYEKHLAKEGKSRMDFDRKTLYNNIATFVRENSGLIYDQFRRLGFMADWNRSVFTLDPHVLTRVFETFKKMEQEGLVYRDNYMVNYCTHCGTSLAELEVQHETRIDPLYYIRYPLRKASPLQDKTGYIVVATVRPEPIFVDTHVAVNPKDKKNKHLIGTIVLNPLTDTPMEIIGDSYVDPDFGTGVVKLTPAHDQNDFTVAKKLGLPIVRAITLQGRIDQNGGAYAGMTVKKARAAVVEELKRKDLIEKIDTNYEHAVTVCYKCKRDLEPMIIPNWYIKVESLKKSAIVAIQKDAVQFHPKKYKRHILQWLRAMHDWPISRQNAWGIRIPVWYSVDDNPHMHVVFLDSKGNSVQGEIHTLLKKHSFDTIETGLQRVSPPNDATYVVSHNKPEGTQYLQETDTFDTWFSSGQWPLVTLREDEYQTRFPTDMMGTLADILNFWVSRMIMFSLYLQHTVPFKHVYLWSMVADSKGQKMSKSKGNVLNPIQLVDQYGADAFRASLIFGLSQGGKVILADEKVRAMRNFANKVWNIGRFILLQKSHSVPLSGTPRDKQSEKIIKKMNTEYEALEKKYEKNMEAFKLSPAFNGVYDFLWHRFADVYIEQLKKAVLAGDEEARLALEKTYMAAARLLHPFMPFVTDAVYESYYGVDTSIISSNQT
ncbi:valine--tRNA ligase [Candidatus Roizmanbacteria bacterium CG10_big_fil_rev_8_21_14_0_10_45_7]|uniref:Valine--tRNA ligase n=1 Tax=Candidatus Roizmanbacteria bacterium CG10_big_fil_rev_8_21_14_0_10_45_7 TaxID=1974854 RepID=A0A2M8KVR0_9BACT|nr:MAG: valine--tRNA ligase [Candidatus Roizmanbacteria bacterium CG10_big_fil_rev_8_21_14_0_10_45_7]